MKKTIITIISIIIIVLIGFYIYAIIMAKASQKMPVVSISKELKELEKKILIETQGGSVYIYPIPKHELEDCNTSLNIDLSIRNDSISQSKESLDNYINSVRNRVNNKLIDKKCIDSLIIDVSSFHSKETIDSLKTKHYRYSFLIE